MIDARRIPAGTQFRHAGDLKPLDRLIDLQTIDLDLLGAFHEVIHAHDDAPAGLDLALLPHGRRGNLTLKPSLFDGRYDTAQRVDLVEHVKRFALK